MAVQINVMNQKRRKNPSLMKLFIYTFLSFFLGTFIILSYPSTLNRTRSLLGFHKGFVKPYETFELGFNEKIPDDVVDKIKSDLGALELDGKKRFKFTQDSKSKFSYELGSGEKSIYTSFIVPVGHLYWIKDGVGTQDFNSDIYTQSEDDSLFASLLSERYPNVNFLGNDDILEKLSSDENTFGIVDFSDLNAHFKLLNLDGSYFLDDPEGGIEYSLNIENLSEAGESVLKKALSRSFSSSFDRENVVKINMTGVTAITRGLASKVDSSGDMGYPARKIADFLKDADIVHISNEVSFVPGCAPSDGMRFCSRPEYIKALEEVGTNIVSLTGNHNNDYGALYNSQTLEMYKDRGWDYYGGGLNSEDAKKILYKDINGSKIAFLGYNYYDSMLNTFALAGESRAGSNSYSEEKMKNDIEEARKNSDVIIVDFQFQECYSYPAIGAYMPLCYKPLSWPDQKSLFRKAVEFGADIVVGVQAHQPQTYEIYNDKVIFYGLGNIFFDQILWPGTRHGLVLTHYIHEGNLLQTRITTTDYDRSMQPFVTEGESRELLLRLLRDAR